MPEPPARGDRTPSSYTPYLYIPYDGTDKGKRPLSKQIQFWASPHIFVDKTDAFGNVVPGEEITISARVFNGGQKAALPFVSVQFFVFNSSLAFTAANSLYTATVQPLQQIAAGSYIEVTSPKPWIPEPLDNGHPCIVVQCDTVEEGSDGLKYPFFPALDRHVAQHNMTVANPTAGQKLLLHASNPFKRAVAYRLALSSLLIRGDFDDLRQGNVPTLMSLLASIETDSKPGFIEQQLNMRKKNITGMELGVNLEDIQYQQEAPGDQTVSITLQNYIQQLNANDPDFNPQTLGNTLGTFELAPDTACDLLISAQPTDLGGDGYIVHHFTQIIENCVVGGYTLVVPPMNF
ncbi:hypothetical protein KDH_01090 [Dictyobacter sp. S3.2.2.5]|uniref:CARDB domain-containing protein n=1 Tax=Dictyobacter halimunensis TaxID=3026934 RepID=A0ABQ6FI52_9CHLR|nr:hypothetical protein KDH_01090 [Dictyobacter sp. S3.2.2.5]